MSEGVLNTTDGRETEALMRGELALGDQALAGVTPVLSHLLTSAGHGLVNEDIVARIRGMLGDLADQLLRAEVAALGKHGHPVPSEERADRLAGRLAENGIVLGYCYSVAIEALVTEDLEQRTGIDQVLSPLMQELIASDDAATADLAMAAMAAQARFVQTQRRMSLPLTEVPADLFHELVKLWSNFARDIDPATRSQIEAMLRANHDETSSRHGLLTRLVSRLNSGALVALAVEHGGFALFATGLASMARQPRELAVLSCHPRQQARLALTLRAAGMKPAEIAQQLLVIQPDSALPEGFAEIGSDQAREMLDSSALGSGQ